MLTNSPLKQHLGPTGCYNGSREDAGVFGVGVLGRTVEIRAARLAWKCVRLYKPNAQLAF